MMDILDFYKILADETRLKILLILQSQQKSLCVCELMASLELSQPKISRHLALLRSHQLVIASKQGKWVYYRMNTEIEAWMLNILAINVQTQQDFFQTELQRLTTFNKEQ